MVKDIFEFTVKENVDMRVQCVSSVDNNADGNLGESHCQIHNFHLEYGMQWRNSLDHTMNLMSLDSNEILDNDGRYLRHFTSFPSDSSSGVNVFSHDLKLEVNPYVFPPFNLIFPLLNFLKN